MRAEEAIRQLKHLETYCLGGAVEDKAWGKDVQALSIAIKALEKQVSTKPYINWNGNEEEISCPTCRNYICYPDEINDVGKRYRKYCGICGQKMDWN